jgi:H+/Cl- antiporter ClcA
MQLKKLWPLPSNKIVDPFEKIIELWHKGAAWVLGPLLVGAAAVMLAMGGEKLTEVFTEVTHAYPYAPIVFMPLGFALLAYLGRRFFAGTQGSGIPQTIAALDEKQDEKRHHLLSPRIAIGKFMLTLGGLSIGASIGREGPTVQIGASIMHMFYGRGPFQNPEARRVLILAGGAAGIAAAFNTPLAGIMFAIEELSKKYVFKANSSTLITVIISGLIAISMLGNYTYFGKTGAHLDWENGIRTVLICGIVGGAFGGLFSQSLISLTMRIPTRLSQFMRRRAIVFAALCGLLVAVLGVYSGGLLFGTGYQATRMTLENSAALPWYFGIGKLIVTLASSVSGIAGGVFAPSLSVGAGLGENIASLFPHMASHSAIILLVMSAYLSGVTRAPVTSFIIMMEMTNSHHMLIPLMSAAVIASGVSKLICPIPLYHQLAARFNDGYVSK